MFNQDLTEHYLQGRLTIDEYLRIANDREIKYALRTIRGERNQLNLEDYYKNEERKKESAR